MNEKKRISYEDFKERERERKKAGYSVWEGVDNRAVSIATTPMYATSAIYPAPYSPAPYSPAPYSPEDERVQQLEALVQQLQAKLDSQLNGQLNGQKIVYTLPDIERPGRKFRDME